ncbi:indole-3-glycerol phosphate synthase TrpC [Acaryochloris marina]|uniref:indole-3-glycerol phosphate synthase TrpC n=1 Tax=Acaryochloris marina TaxID=155978 RepID=UPI001BAFACDB|nr:indole-3-glycerol phosphate synthase TrpC [Acaryochloris marina]QUY45084.1 indole-3-glycerol phosphate synthase TrpC [Acaryochloris marina S15]
MQIRRRPPSVAISIQELQYKVKTPENEPRNILEKIVWFKETEVEQMRESVSLLDLRKQVATCEPPLSFIEALKDGKTQPALIAEVKKASPSKGVLRENFDPVAIAQAYEASGASCLSVLTDSEFFQGSFDYLQQIREAVGIPLLCKEFVIYPYQIYLARSRGADAVLLIAAILSDQDLTYFLKIIKSLGMTALVEVHTLPELERVMKVPGVELIGINNRDLETFTVDLQVTCQLLAQQRAALQNQNILVVSESGLHTSADLAQVKQAGAGAVLIGESLVKETGDVLTHSETEQMQAKISALFS